MSKIVPSLALLAGLLTVVPSPALAIDWLGIRTNQNLEDNLRRHQQDGARQQNRRVEQNRPAKPSQQSRSMSPRAEAQARAEGQRIMDGHRPRLDREYRQRVQRDGQRSADRWIKNESFAIGERVGRDMMAKYAGK